MSNVFSFTGTVVRDAEVRYLASGAAVLNVTVANNIGFGEKQKTLFIRVARFGKQAEGILKDYLVKGQKVFVSGELSENEYKANDGTDKKSLELVANIIDLIGKKSDPGAQPQAAQSQDQGKPAGNQNTDPYPDNYDDSIPF
jgi:single-strand DNA-binding protein